MKSLIISATLLLGLAAHGADRKLGNVIVVERDIENIYQSCLDDVRGSIGEPQMFFSCTINLLKHPGEVLLNKGGGMRYSTPACKVTADFGNGKMLMFFGTTDDMSSYEASKSCLQAALNENTDMVAIVQTIEK